MIGVQAPARIGFEHRGASLLHVQEHGIVVRRHEQEDAAHRADTSHPDHLDRVIEEVVAVEQGPGAGQSR